MKKLIVFTQLRGPSAWQYKIARVLRKKKYETSIFLILKIKGYGKNSCKKAFSEIYSLELDNLKPKTVFKSFFLNPSRFFHFFWKLFTIKPYVAICEGAPHYLASLFMIAFKRRCKKIYFPYDMNFSRLKNPEKIIPRHELYGEKYAFKICDGVMNKSDVGEFKLLPGELNVLSKPHLSFPCYVLGEWNKKYDKRKKLSFKDKEIHVVFVGDIDIVSRVGAPLKDVFKIIVGEKIHLHIYQSRRKLPKSQLEEIAPVKELKKYLHIHQYVLPHKLSEEISKYDFGLFPVNYSPLTKPGAEKYASGNKVASYLEACLPVIIKRKVELYSKPLEKYKAGIIVNNDYSDIKKLLKKAMNKNNYEKLVRNVENFRKEYSVERHIKELIKFTNPL